VWEGVRVHDLLRNARGRVTGVRATLPERGDVDLQAAIVVGADGLRSLVARRLGLARQSRWPRRIALVTHYRGIADVGDLGEMHVEHGGYLGIADVGGGISNVAVVIPSSRGRELASGSEAFVERWIASHPQLAPRFATAERTSPVRATGPFASRSRRAWSPGAALVGDAADFFDPFTGEGIYAALRGGELLAPYLVEALRLGRAREHEALAAYDRCRRYEFGGKWMVERLIGAAVAFPALLERAARVLAKRPDMADLLVGVTGDFVPAREVLSPRYLARLLLLPA
jgi:flavin-dependent dehydrogenase